ncbi:hypothetical protein ACFQ78_33055 [Streptomyces sp. NPDC056519]|uniref:hypothetical protein n=1 Tax=Streptomyces sp. NPDC056519 TaxID=3345849 RepID=UPI0036A42189
MKTKIQSVLGTALLLCAALATTAATGGSASAQVTGPSSPPAAGVRPVGRWTEAVDRERPGITHYIQELTLTPDGRFRQVDNVICNLDDCPMFKIGVNTGTYRTEGRALHLDGNLSDLHGTVRSRNTLVLDGRVLHRTYESGAE